MISWFKNFFYERDRSGNHNYWIDKGNCSWGDYQNRLEIAYTNPILMPAINYIAQRFSNADFFIKSKNGDLTKDHWLVDLLNNPNPDQSKNEFLSNLIWYKIVFGYVYIYKKFPVGTNNNGSLYTLNPSNIEFKQNVKTEMIFNDEERDISFNYNSENENININFTDVIPLFDLPNGMCEDLLIKSPSRLDALAKPIETISMAYDAKNKVIPQNGDRLFTHNGDLSNPLLESEKQEIQNRLNNRYGLGKNRSRNIVTASNIKAESLHISLSDLGLDESIIKDAEKIIIGLDIPIDGLRYDPKKSTFENQKQSEIKFYQNVIFPVAEDMTLEFTRQLLKDEDVKLVAKFDKIPILQDLKLEEINVLKSKLEAYSTMVGLGVDKKQAAELSQLNELNFN